MIQPPAIGLPPCQFAAAFPFHFAVDRELRLVAVGASLARLAPEASPGRGLLEVASFRSPRGPIDFQSLAARTDGLVLLELRQRGAVLRGQLVPVESGALLLFLGSPWVSCPADLPALGLTTGDFARHDSVTDLLMVMQASASALADAKRLAERLERSRAEQRRVALRLELQQAIRAALEETATSGPPLQGALSVLCRKLEWDVAELWTPDPTGRHLRREAGWNEPSPALEAFAAASAPLRFASGQGLQGICWRDQAARWSEDVQRDPDFRGAERAVAGGLRAACSVPLQAGGEPIGVLQLFRRTAAPRDQDTFQTIVEVGFKLGVALARRRSDEAARASAARYRAVVDGIREVIFQTDEGGAWTFLGPAWLRVAGTPPDASLGEQVERSLLPEDHAAWREAFAALAQGREQERPLLVRLGRHGAAHRWVELSLRATRDEAGAFCGAFGILFDVTARREAETALLQAKDSAERATRAKSDFLATMSHEIRTPLNGLIGTLTLALGTGLTPDQREYVETAHASAEGLLALLSDLLDLSRVEAGQLRFERVAFPLRAVVERALKPVRSKAFSKGLAFRLAVDDGLPAVVAGDPVRFCQVLVNLASNAVKFTDQGEVEVSLRLLGLQPGQVTVELEVSDTGIGIPQDRRAGLFTPFGQVDSSISRRYGGSGLGLAISQQLAQLMGGRISVESVPGRGSTFRCALELARQAEGVTPLTAANALPLAETPRRRVLVAEDNPVNLLVTTRLLEQLGHQVVAVEDGARALAAMAAGPFDLVLMDVQMPVMDGLTAITRRRAAEALGAPRQHMVALTAQAMAGDRERCLTAGADGYLSKPIRPGELAAAVATAPSRAAPAELAPEARPTAAASAEASPLPVIDRGLALEMVGGDAALLAETARLLASTLAGSRTALEQGARQLDLPALARASHKVKSGLDAVGARQARACAAEVERLARDEDPTAALATADLLAALDRVLPALRALGEPA